MFPYIFTCIEIILFSKIVRIAHSTDSCFNNTINRVPFSFIYNPFRTIPLHWSKKNKRYNFFFQSVIIDRQIIFRAKENSISFFPLYIHAYLYEINLRVQKPRKSIHRDGGNRKLFPKLRTKDGVKADAGRICRRKAVILFPGSWRKEGRGGKVNGGARADSGRRLRRLGVIMCEDRVTCRTFQQPPESESTLASWPVELNS